MERRVGETRVCVWGVMLRVRGNFTEQVAAHVCL